MPQRIRLTAVPTFCSAAAIRTSLTRERLRKENKDPDQVPKAERDGVYTMVKAQIDKEHDEVVALGGLHIVAPSGMNRGVSTISSADAPDDRAIWAARAFIFRRVRRFNAHFSAASVCRT